VSGTAPPGRTGFADHFSRDSASYAAFRPRYPAELFTFIAGLPASRGLAWDVGTGSGQAVSMLARYFDRVAASDASVAQLRARTRAQGVYYLAERGEASAIAGGRVDLVTVAQAYHWLDHQAFHAEVDRVIAPGGALAVWCYGKLDATPDIEAALTAFYDGTVGPYWPAERAHVERAYRHFEIPIDEVPAPRISIDAQFTLAQLLGYVSSWSAVGRFIKANGHDPVPELGRVLGSLWGNPDTPRRMVWPISVRAGRWRGAGARGR
jgi:SAM-dependent methyltransferase